MLSVIGYSLVFVLALVLILVFPLTEFARGMASNPSAHELSKGGCIASIIGLMLMGWFFWDIFA